MVDGQAVPVVEGVVAHTHYVDGEGAGYDQVAVAVGLHAYHWVGQEVGVEVLPIGGE